MNVLYHKARHAAGMFVRALHPRAIAWQLRHAQRDPHAVITKLGLEGRLKVRIHSNDVLGKYIYQHRICEEAEVRLVTGFLKPGMCFFDIGANMGQYTLLGAERVGPSGRVHSFEPSTRMFGELRFNVELNNLGSRCCLNNLALSDSEGTAKLSRYEAGMEVYGSLARSTFPNITALSYDDVQTATIDGYVSKLSIDHVDLIKMDIEGAELLALRGGAALLRSPNAPAILIEMADINTLGFDYGALEIWDYLESVGYRWFRFNRRGLLSYASRPTNFEVGRNLLAVKCVFERWHYTPDRH